VGCQAFSHFSGFLSSSRTYFCYPALSLTPKDYNTRNSAVKKYWWDSAVLVGARTASGELTEALGVPFAFCVFFTP